ncbi:MAG TPA: glycosyltransferase family 39 protein [Rhodanobacteraceae bacterium]|nr:glycosyltransferase family 39 protein [Rhodanobacteraceae bacterium]
MNAAAEPAAGCAPRRRTASPGWWVAIGLAWCALNGVLLWAYYLPAAKHLVGDETTYHLRALALLAGTPGPPSFIWPPGQDLFLAIIYAVTGPRLIAVQLVQIALLAWCSWLLMRLWRVIDGRRAGLCAGAIFLLNPSTLAYAWWLWPEVPHLACVLGALGLLALPGTRPPLRAFFAGALVGAALLLKSLLAGFWPLFLIFLWRRDHGRWRCEWLATVAFLVALAATLAPSLWQGYRETGRALIADSSIYNLYVGLNDSSRSDYIGEADGPALQAFLDSGATPRQRNAAYLGKLRDLVAERGVGSILMAQLGHQFFRLFSAKTTLVSQMPGPACAGHIGAYADGPLTGPLIALAWLSHALTLVLSAFGLTCWRRWRQPLALFALAILAYQLALFLGLHVMERYIVQMLPFLCAFAGSFAAAIAFGPRSREDGAAIALTPARLTLGAMLAGLLLFLAFAGPLLDRACG